MGISDLALFIFWHLFFRKEIISLWDGMYYYPPIAQHLIFFLNVTKSQFMPAPHREAAP